MKNFIRAQDVISRDESAVVVFTKGLYLYFGSDGKGESGKWVLNPEKLQTVDKVIIYLRDESRKVNKIYLANYAGYRKSDVSKRYYIQLSNIQEVGRTASNWLDFAESGQNPVAYIINE